MSPGVSLTVTAGAASAAAGATSPLSSTVSESANGTTSKRAVLPANAPELLARPARAAQQVIDERSGRRIEHGDGDP